MTLAGAVESFLRDTGARGLSASTHRGDSSTLGQFAAYAGERGKGLLASVDGAMLRAWRDS